MAGKFLIKFLFIFIIYYERERTLATKPVKKNLCDVLTELLEHPQWSRITNVAKVQHPDFPDEFVSFSGKDLYIFNDLVSHTKDVGNIYVNVDNVYKKLYMVTNLLGCVYANAIDTFTTLIKNLLSVASVIRRASRQSAYKKCKSLTIKKILLENKAREQIQSKKSKTKTQHDQSPSEKNENSDDEIENEHNIVNVEVNSGVPPLDHFTDFTGSWKIFNFTYQQLLNSRPMFECMYDALVFLFKLVSPEEDVVHFDNYVRKLIRLVRWYKNTPKNLKKLLPTYIGVHDDDYKSKNGILSRLLLKFISLQNKKFLSPFVETYCIRSVKNNQTIQKMVQTFQIQFPFKEKSDIMYQFGDQIQELVENVIDNYYLDLGFKNIKNI